MNAQVLWLLLGVSTLAVVMVAIGAVVRRRDDAAFYLIAAGMLAIAFFVTLPGWPLLALGAPALLITVGILLAPPAVAEDDLAESTLTHRRRRM